MSGLAYRRLALAALLLALMSVKLARVSGEEWVPAQHAWSGPAHFDPALATSWVDAGARYVGGCCRVGPREIAGIADALR